MPGLPPPPAPPPDWLQALPPPAELAHLARHLSPAALLVLLQEHGGTRLYIPHQPSQASPVAQAVGHEGALALAAAMGGETLKVPLARHWRICCLHAQGLTYGQIAKRLGIGEGAVWRNLNAARRTASQPDLFAKR